MRSTTVAAFLAAFVASASAHMQVIDPPVLRGKTNTLAKNIDFDMVAPLAPDGSNFPCKGYLKDLSTPEGGSSKTFVAGQPATFKTEGVEAAHNGGSCQVSLSFDQGQTWKVIKSFIGNCVRSSGGNVFDPNQVYDFTIPEDAKAGDAIWAWTWFNQSGNREMYMNCAHITIEGTGTSTLDDHPAMFVANVANGCSTEESKDVEFPDPGEDVDRQPANNKAPTAPPVGNCPRGPGAPKPATPGADAPKSAPPGADAPEPAPPGPDTPETATPDADTPELDAPELDAPEPDAPEPDAEETDAEETGAEETGAEETETGAEETGAEETDAEETDAAEPGAAEPGADELGAAEPDAAEPDTDDLDAAEPVTDDLDAAEPDAAEPGTDDLDATEPSTDDLDAAEPVTDELDTAEPVTDELGAAEPATDELDAAEPSTDELGAAEPVTDELDAAEPVTDELDAAEPVTDELDAAEPDAAEPDAAEPGTDGLDATEPSLDELDAAEPDAELGADESDAADPALDTLATSGRTYTVKSGEFCKTIAQANGVTVEGLLAANPGINSGCTNLQPGQVLNLRRRSRIMRQIA